VFSGVLVGNQRGNIRFDASSPDSNHFTAVSRFQTATVEGLTDNCSNETTYSGAVCHRPGQSRYCQNKETKHVDEAKNDNCFVSPKILVGDDRPKYWSEIAFMFRQLSANIIYPLTATYRRMRRMYSGQ
jgi:hypothetical protein